MQDDETITFSKKELELIMGVCANAIEWTLIPNLPYYVTNDNEVLLDNDELKKFEDKLQKMCLL
jgi:hypothetical protein